MAWGRKCSESCVEYLLMEIVRHYRLEDCGAPLQAALDAIGYRVGQQLVERYTRERAPMPEVLDVMKFVCKEFWTEVYGKSIDNLRTNHRGTYVLRDTQFRWLRRLAQNQLPPQIGQPLPAPVPRQELADDYLRLPAALLRGALGALGLEASVEADASSLPQVDFTVVLRGGPPPR